MPLRPHAGILESLYGQLTRRRYVEPDPLQFLYAYAGQDDREIVALVAACLAYGRVRQILAGVADVLERMGPSPAAFVAGTSPRKMREAMSGFRHRFSDGDNVAALLTGAAGVVKKHGSLQACFVDGMKPRDETVMPAVGRFANKLCETAGGDPGHLVPQPERGSACKRLHLMLRWLVRRDDVDPGGWDDVPAGRLIVPLDTHMHRIALRLGLTSRKAADGKTAMEATDAFRRVSRSDPVKYDFALTRLGIRAEMDVESFLARCRDNGRERDHA